MHKKAAGKKSLIIWIIVLAILAIGGYAYYSITGSPTVKAQLNYEGGRVLVNDNSVSGTVKLRQGDSVETKEDGEASVILYESVIISLEPLTKVTVEELAKKHPQMIQQSGTTFNQFTRLLGVEGYSIKAGNSVASVRATSFEFAEGTITAAEGTVTYEIEDRTFSVAAGKVVEKINGEYAEREIAPEERARMVNHMKRIVKNLQHLRKLEADKHPMLKKRLMKTYEVDEQGLKAKLDSIDRGELDVEELRRKSPIKMKSIDKIAEISKVIQKINSDIGALEG